MQVFDAGNPGTLVTGDNVGAPFSPKTGKLHFGLSFTKGAMTSFVCYLEALGSDNVWYRLKDATGADLSLFGTVNATVATPYTRPTAVAAQFVPSRGQLRVVPSVT